MLIVWTFVYKVTFLVVSEREKFLLEVNQNLFILSYQHLLQQIIKLRFRMKESETVLQLYVILSHLYKQHVQQRYIKKLKICDEAMKC